MTCFFILDKVSMMGSRDEEKNFIKLAEIILNIVPKYLRELFLQKWNEKFPTLHWNRKTEHRVELLGHIQKAAWKKSTHFVKFEKMIEAQSSFSWDATLLLFLFLYSEIGLLDKCRSEGKRNPPLLISEEVDKIRCIRNSFFAYLPNMSCSATDFTQLTTELKCAARNAFGQSSENEIDAELTSGIERQLSDQLRQQLDKESKLNEELQMLTDEYDEELKGKNLNY